MARAKLLRVRLSDEEWARLEAYARAKEHKLTEVIRDYVKRLPKAHSLRSVSFVVAIHLPLSFALTGVLSLH